MMIGTLAVSGSRRSRRHTSIPETPSIIQSRITRSGGLSRAISSASSPSAVASTSNSSRSKMEGQQLDEGAIVLDEQDAALAHALPPSSSGLDAGRVGALGAVAEMLAGRGEIDHLGDVGRMIADPLEILGDEQQVRRRRDVVRIFHHVGEQGAEDRIVEIVDRRVALAHRLRLGGVALRRRRRARCGPSRRRSAPFPGAATAA